MRPEVVLIAVFWFFGIQPWDGRRLILGMHSIQKQNWFSEAMNSKDFRDQHLRCNAMDFLYTKSLRKFGSTRDAELLAVLSQNIGADDMGVGRRIVSKVFFQRLFLFKGHGPRADS